MYLNALLSLLVLILLAGIGFAVLCRWPQRLRDEIKQLRRIASASAATEAQAEMLYQLALPQPVLPQATGLSPFDRGTWSVVAGAGKGWPGGIFYKVRGLASAQGRLYASVTGPKADGPQGQVWGFEDNAWRQIGGSMNGSWDADVSFIDHLYSDNDGSLLAAEKSGVWRYAADRWTKLAGLTLTEKSGPYCFSEWNGKTVMGQWGEPRVAMLGADGAWSYLPNPSGGWGAGARTIYCLVEWNGCLYAGTGTGKFTGPASAVWRFDGRQWEKVGGSGVRGSWIRDGIPFVLSLTVFGDRLIATVSRPADTPHGASNVWVFDGKQWGPLAVGKTPFAMGQSLIMNDAIVYKGRLVVATGHETRRDAQIWELGSDQCWRAVGPASLEAPEKGDGGWWVYRLCTDGERLFASTAGHPGAAGVLCFTAERS